MKNNKGFTLLEILLVVAAIAILAGIVILAINPNKQLAETRNAERRADVNTLINAVYQYAIDNDNIPATIETDAEGDCPADDTGVDSAICADGQTCDTSVIDLETTLVSDYLAAIPADPNYTSGLDSLYDIVEDSNNRVTVCAPSAEDGQTISVTR